MTNEINVMRQKLYELVNNNANFQQIYKASVKLDTLIVIYHKRLANAKKNTA